MTESAMASTRAVHCQLIWACGQHLRHVNHICSAFEVDECQLENVRVHNWVRFDAC